MTSKPVALLLATLGVLPSHSWPHVSDDNPFSEAQFKTLKYRPAFPARFGSLEDAEAFCHRRVRLQPSAMMTAAHSEADEVGRPPDREDQDVTAVTITVGRGRRKLAEWQRRD
jgi:hypothetical protein